jgi:DNA-binding NarL/FixJ family response regulator
MMPNAAEVATNLGTACRNASAPPRRPLTPHEIRIVGMLAGGASYQVVANRLGVTVNTVRNYIRSIYGKLHVHTKSEAVSRALREGIID